MRRIVILLGALCLQQAYAQQEGKVGVNTETPSATLNVKSKTGTTNSTKNLELENANGDKLATVLDNGNVGIGTTVPSVKLDVVSGTEGGAFRMADGSQGANKILTSDANGNATWKLKSIYYKKFAAKTDVDVIYERSIGTDLPGIGSYSAPETGYYQVSYHSFLQTETTGTKSFYFCIFRNGNYFNCDETYNYVMENTWFNSHYNTIIYLEKGDVINFQLKVFTGAPLKIVSGQARRNIVEVVYLGI